MNKDIRLSVGFWEHPKTIKLERKLGLEGVRSLQILWLWVSQNRPDGVLSGMDVDDIEIASKWNGEAEKFYTSLVALGWIDYVNDVNVLHDWAEHNPWQAEADLRSEKARKSAQARWSKEKDTHGTCVKDAQAMLPQCSSNATAMLPHEFSNAPLLSSPLQEEEREYYPPIVPPRGTVDVSGAADAILTGTALQAESPVPDISKTPKVPDSEQKFDYFWAAYPKKTGKKAARRAWDKARGKPPIAQVVAAVEAQKLWPQWTRDDGQYIPNPATWLNQGRWDDEPPTVINPLDAWAIAGDAADEERRRREEIEKPLRPPQLVSQMDDLPF